MPKKKRFELQSAECGGVASLRVKSALLRLDEQGRIVEEPNLLRLFIKFVTAMSEAMGKQFLFGDICVIEGAYVVDVLCAPGLEENGREIAAFIESYEKDVAQLASNEASGEGKNAPDCGVSAPSFDVLQAASALAGADHYVSVVLNEGQEHKLKVPSDADIAAALPSQEKKPRKVNGKITGIGRGDSKGCRIEVARGSTFAVRGLDLDAAFDLLRHPVHVSGLANWEDDAYILDEPSFIREFGFDFSA